MVSPNSDYLITQFYKGVAIEGQPELQYYYHRSLQDIFGLALENGFVMDGFYEVPFEGEQEPIIMVVRVRKMK